MHGGEPISFQVHGTSGGICEWSNPFERGGMWQERVDLTQGLPNRASRGVQSLVAEGACWVYIRRKQEYMEINTKVMATDRKYKKHIKRMTPSLILVWLTVLHAGHHLA